MKSQVLFIMVLLMKGFVFASNIEEVQNIKFSCISNNSQIAVNLEVQVKRDVNSFNRGVIDGYLSIKNESSNWKKISVIGYYSDTGRELIFDVSPRYEQQYDIFRKMRIIPFGERGLFLSIEFEDESPFFTVDIDCI